MHHNFLFDLDQTLLDFHASEYKALGIVLRASGLSFSDEMDGALDFVRKVKETIPDSRIFIASNGATVNAKGRIASTGLGRYIDGLFISEDLGVTKPDPAFFEICLSRIGEPKSSCVMIGDSLSSDMLGAKNAALDSVWFMPSGNVEEAMAAYDINYCAASFDELYDILAQWAAGKEQDSRRDRP